MVWNHPIQFINFFSFPYIAVRTRHLLTSEPADPTPADAIYQLLINRFLFRVYKFVYFVSLNMCVPIKNYNSSCILPRISVIVINIYLYCTTNFPCNNFVSCVWMRVCLNHHFHHHQNSMYFHLHLQHYCFLLHPNNRSCKWSEPYEAITPWESKQWGESIARCKTINCSKFDM